MATELLYPDANSGTDNSWNLGAGPTKWQACLTNDGDTTYIDISGSLVYWQGFEKNDSAIGAGDTINGVKIHAWVKVNKNGKKSKLQYRVGGSTAQSAQMSVANGTYTQITYDMGATNPITALAWVLDDIDGTRRFEMGVNNNSANALYQCTQIWCEVDYTPAATGVKIPVVLNQYRRRRV